MFITSWRSGGALSVLFLVLAWAGCGETFRPVATPILPPSVSPGASHFVLALSNNGPDNPGASTRVDVSGDSNVGVAPLALGPVHAALLPNNSRIYVANSVEGSVSSFAPTSISPVTTTSLPRTFVSITAASGNDPKTGDTTYTTPISGLPLGVGMTIAVTNMDDSGNNGTFIITASSAATFTVLNPSGVTRSGQNGSGIASSTPVFVASTENATVYVANYGSNTVSAISTTNNSVIDPPITVGANPVALAETPDGTKLYAVNEGGGTVTSISTPNRTPVAKISISSPPACPPTAGSKPVWAVARPDSARVYVLESAGGLVYTINTTTDELVGCPADVGRGANFMVYDKNRTRLYVANPQLPNVSLLDASVDPPSLIATINLATAPSGSVALCASATRCVPVSITVLPDGSRAYVASYALVPATNPTSLEWQVSVVNTLNNTVRAVVPTDPTSTLVDLDTADATGCGGTRPFGASPLPFRLSVAASADSTKVYVASCDSGNIEIIRTSDDTLITSPDGRVVLGIPAPPSVFPPPTVTITAALQAGSNTIYSYTLPPRPPEPPLRVGMNILITGMADSGNNGAFTITAVSASTFTVMNSSGVTASSQTGIGAATTSPPQNPVFMLAGP